MSKVRFMQSKTKGTYLTDWNYDIDCSGDYYPAADVERLVEASQLSLNWLASYPGEGANKAYEKLKAAIAAAKENKCD